MRAQRREPHDKQYLFNNDDNSVCVSEERNRGACDRYEYGGNHPADDAANESQDRASTAEADVGGLAAGSVSVGHFFVA